MSKLEIFLLNLTAVIMAPFTLVRSILFVIGYLVELIGTIIATPMLLLCIPLDSRINWSNVIDVYKGIWRHLFDIEY